MRTTNVHFPKGNEIVTTAGQGNEIVTTRLAQKWNFFLRHEIFCPQKVLNKAKLRIQGVKVFKLCGFIVKIKKEIR